MDSLPETSLTRILSFLPGKVVSIFQSLNKTIGETIKENRSELPKPTISLTLGHRRYDPNDRMITINYPKGEVWLTIDDAGFVKHWLGGDANYKFVYAFCRLAYLNPTVTRRELLRPWLFGRADVSVLHIIPIPNWIEEARWIIEGMRDANCRCFQVKLLYRNINPQNEVTWKFFERFCQIQRNLGVEPSLRIIPDHKTPHALFEPIHVDFLNKYCLLFQEVSCGQSLTFKLEKKNGFMILTMEKAASPRTANA